MEMKIILSSFLFVGLCQGSHALDGADGSDNESYESAGYPMTPSPSLELLPTITENEGDDIKPLRFTRLRKTNKEKSPRDKLRKERKTSSPREAEALAEDEAIKRAKGRGGIKKKDANF
tara:strand:- start:2786 stop:3142 length:357 start_codon:yes stop_codon:yes gene_type:complete